MDSASALTGSQKMQNGQLKATSTLQSDGQSIYQGMIRPKNFPGLPEGWTSDWETFPSPDSKVQLFAVLHRTDPWKSHRAMLVIHGLGEHGGRYLHFPHYLKSCVDSVYCLDLRGHGRSEGSRGYVDQFDLYTQDVVCAIRHLDEHLRQKFGKSEIHLFCHSMGGLIGIRTLFLNPSLPLASTTMSSPLLKIRAHVPPLKKMVGHTLSRVWGGLQLSNELDVNVLSHDKEVVQAYVKDRLVHDKVTPRLFTEMLEAMSDTMKRTDGLSYPFLMQVPLKDEIVESEAEQEFFRNLKDRDKQLVTYPEFFHESYNEIGKEKAFEDLAKWIKAHSKSS